MIFLVAFCWNCAPNLVSSLSTKVKKDLCAVYQVGNNISGFITLHQKSIYTLSLYSICINKRSNKLMPLPGYIDEWVRKIINDKLYANNIVDGVANWRFIYK